MVVDPLRRFEKIEGARDERDPDAPEAPAQLPRFEAEPEAAPPSEEPPPPAESPVAPRFSAPDELRTMDGPLASLPSLECPACHGENSKFSASCRFCGHSLGGDDAVAHNQGRVQEREAERLKAEVEMERRLARSVPPAAKDAAPQSLLSFLPAPPTARLTAGLATGVVLVGLLSRSACVMVLCVLCALALGALRLLPRSSK